MPVELLRRDSHELIQTKLTITVGNNTSETEVVQSNTGDFFGEGSAFDPQSRASATVRAVVHCELEMLAFNDLRALMEEHLELKSEIKRAARANFVRTNNAAGNDASGASSLYKPGEVTSDTISRRKLEQSLLKKYKKDVEKAEMMRMLHETHASEVEQGSKSRSTRVYPDGGL